MLKITGQIVAALCIGCVMFLVLLFVIKIGVVIINA